MRRYARLILCTTSVLTCVYCAPASAQGVPTTGDSQSAAPVQKGDAASEQDSTAPSAATTDTTDTGDIVVTARRRSESLQNVPQTVTAVGGDTIKKLNITQFQDVASVVPGLTLNNGSVSGGRSPAPSIRGVTYDGSTQASATVDIYLNEVPIGANDAFQALYDVGGIEVLRGPQGTLRGRTAPSGAILIETRRPNTKDWGGYVSGLASSLNAINGQAALNVPLVSDILAVRVAGLVDQNDADRVRSVNIGIKPYRETLSGRASVLFTPSSTIDAQVVYQYLKNDSRIFTAVAGPGAPGGVAVLAPANYNGPALDASDRKGVDDAPRDGHLRSNQVTASANWEVFGHRLSYVGGWNWENSSTHGALDYGNALVGNTYYQDIGTRSRLATQEIRLSSTGKGFLEYSVGYYHSISDSRTAGQQPATALAGSFGSPAQPSPYIFNPRYTLAALITVNSHQKEDSVFGNASMHIGSRLEISGGVRRIVSSTQDTQLVRLGGGFIAQKLPFPCSRAGFGSTYPGYCDIPIAPAATPVQNASRNQKDRPWVYSGSVRYRFSDDILAYANVGTSWRRGAVNITIQNATNDPLLGSFTFLPNETSISYEVGLKTTWLDRRLRVNLAGFYQKFNGLLFQLNGIPIVQNNGASTFVSYGPLNVGADAIVKGFDFDASFQATANWSLGLSVSYADGKVDNQLIPCNDANFDGVADTGTATLAGFQAAKTSVAQCKSSQAVSRDPIWNATLQSEVHTALGKSEAYLRGLFNFYPSNSRANAGFVVPRYGLLNLFAGVRSPDGAWDIGLFARNLTGTAVQLSRESSYLTPAAGTDAVFGTTGYRYVSYTREREVGLTVRYAFGSR